MTRLEEFVWHSAYGALPFLHRACDGDPEADLANHVFLTNHVANRASRAQGQAFLLACRQLFEAPPLPHGHLAVAFGATLRPHLDREALRHLFLFSALRGALSAAVRLGVVGPLRAQRLLLALHPTLDAALDETRTLTEAHTLSVRLDAAQATHDALYSRLFQS